MRLRTHPYEFALYYDARAAGLPGEFGRFIQRRRAQRQSDSTPWDAGQRWSPSRREQPGVVLTSGVRGAPPESRDRRTVQKAETIDEVAPTCGCAVTPA